MRKQGKGHIIQVSSLLGVNPLPLMGMYSASKFAMEALSETLAITRPPQAPLILLSFYLPACSEGIFTFYIGIFTLDILDWKLLLTAKCRTLNVKCKSLFVTSQVV